VPQTHCRRAGKHQGRTENRLRKNSWTIAATMVYYRTRANALQSLGKLKAANALPALVAGSEWRIRRMIFLRNAALRSLGILTTTKVCAASRMVGAGPKQSRRRRIAAIASLGRLERANKEITAQIAGYLTEPHYPIRYAAMRALGSRGDPSAIPALQALLKRDDLSIDMAPTIKQQIAQLQKDDVAKGRRAETDGEKSGTPASKASRSVSTSWNHLLQK